MKLKDLESYYFADKEFQKIREKHFPKLKEILDVNDFFNNETLTEKKFTQKQISMFDKIFNYIKSNKRIRRDFYNAYGVIVIDTMCDLVLESLVVDEAIKTNRNVDIFLDVKSIAYFDDTEYPLNIWHWENQNNSLKEYCREYCRWYDEFDKKSEDDIFGLEFEK